MLFRLRARCRYGPFPPDHIPNGFPQRSQRDRVRGTRSHEEEAWRVRSAAEDRSERWVLATATTEMRHIAEHEPQITGTSSHWRIKLEAEAAELKPATGANFV